MGTEEPSAAFPSARSGAECRPTDTEQDLRKEKQKAQTNNAAMLFMCSFSFSCCCHCEMRLCIFAGRR